MSQRIVVTPPVRLSYPHLWTPVPFTEVVNGVKRAKGDPEYSAEFLITPELFDRFQVFDKDSDAFVTKNYKDIAKELVEEEFPGLNIQEAVKTAGKEGLHWPIKDGTEIFKTRGEKAKAYEGMLVVRGKALNEINGESNSPRLFYKDTTGGTNARVFIPRTESNKESAESYFYGGAYAYAEISVVCKQGPQSRYVTNYINSVVFLKHGERFGSPSVLDKFDGVMGGYSDYDPTEGMEEASSLAF